MKQQPLIRNTQGDSLSVGWTIPLFQTKGSIQVSCLFYMDEKQLEVPEEVVEGIKASASKGKKAYVDIH